MWCGRLKLNIITIGEGDYWKNLLVPSLQQLEREGLLHHIASVDIRQQSHTDDLDHLLRQENQPLSDLLAKFESQSPVVILGHANDWHTRDTVDLLDHGFHVVLEKPYCLDPSELRALNSSLTEHSANLTLAEYYLMMKSIPLLIVAGKVKPDSFYYQKEGVVRVHEGLRPYATNLDAISGKLLELIGRPRLVYADVLEGEGSTGRVEHRGSHVTDLKKGGGMIQDLTSHAVIALFALEDYIGAIDTTFSAGKVLVAHCREYKNWAQEKLQLPEERIGETYAEMEFVTSTGVPVRAAVGKYILKQKNQRRIVIVGDEGQALLDMSSCTLSLSDGDKVPQKILEIPKSPESKYYPVVRTCLEIIAGTSPYTFDATKAAYDAQKLILNIAEKAAAQDKVHLYPAEALPREIFP